jgi:hypothetical protein
VAGILLFAKYVVIYFQTFFNLDREFYMHKSKGQRAAAASARTNKVRKHNELKRQGESPAVQAKSEYSRNKNRPSFPMREENSHATLAPRRDLPFSLGERGPLAASMMFMAGKAGSATPRIEMLDALMDTFAAPGGPEVLEITVGEDLSTLRPKRNALKEKTAFRRDSFLELVEELNRRNPV